MPGFDYSQPRAYFVTICTNRHTAKFGRVMDGVMVLNARGEIASVEWKRLPERFPKIETDIFIIMPNHIHGIIVIHDPASAESVEITTVGAIVGAYKSIVFQKCLKVCKDQNMVLGKFWQRNYYEHIIRDDESYQSIAEYILANPLNWDRDSLHIVPP